MKDDDEKCGSHDDGPCPLGSDLSWLDDFARQVQQGVGMYQTLAKMVRQASVLKEWVRGAASNELVRWDTPVSVNLHVKYQVPAGGDQQHASELTLTELVVPMEVILGLLIHLTKFLLKHCKRHSEGMDKLQAIVESVAPFVARTSGEAN